MRRLQNTGVYRTKLFHANLSQTCSVPPQLTQDSISLCRYQYFAVWSGAQRGDWSAQMSVSWFIACRVFFQLQLLLLEMYTKMWKIMSPVECFIQEREVASLSLLLKLKGKGFCHLLFSWKKKKQTNTKSRNLLSWFLLTAHPKEMQKYQVYVFCSSGKLLIWVVFAGGKMQRAAVASARLANNLKETTNPWNFLILIKDEAIFLWVRRWNL